MTLLQHPLEFLGSYGSCSKSLAVVPRIDPGLVIMDMDLAPGHLTSQLAVITAYVVYKMMVNVYFVTYRIIVKDTYPMHIFYIQSSTPICVR